MAKPLSPEEAARMLKECGEELNSLVKEAQSILARYVVPDGKLSAKDALADLLGLLDGREQRRAQGNWAAAVAKAEGRVLVLAPKQDRN